MIWQAFAYSVSVSVDSDQGLAGVSLRSLHAIMWILDLGFGIPTS